MLEADPKSAELGNMLRVPLGRTVDMISEDVQFNASKIKVPTLVVRGNMDTFGTRADCQILVNELSSKIKRFVEIENASHQIPYEKANAEFFEVVKRFLAE
jgi:alpha-beta hydrolase superfamily lysophospholipase